MKRLLSFGIFLSVLWCPSASALTRLIEVLAVGVTDNAGKPVASGEVTVYDAGTTNLRTVYEDFNLSSPAANPIELDHAGRAVVYTDKRVKLVITTSTGAAVRTIDDVGTAGSDLAVDISDTTLAGDGLIAPGDGSLAVNTDNSTLEVVADTVQLKSTITGDRTITGAITTTGNGTIGGTLKVGGSSGAALSNSGTALVTGSKIYPSASTGAALATSSSSRTLQVETTGGGASRPIVVSASPGTHGLMIVRGHVDASGNNPGSGTSFGEGFTVSAFNGGAGTSTITFSTAFAEKPVCTVTGSAVAGAGYCWIPAGNPSSTTTVGIDCQTGGGSAVGGTYDFICIGQRGS